MPYYKPESVTAVTMTDASKQMLWHAKQKQSQQNANLPVKFCLADAQAMLSVPDAGNFPLSRPDSDAPQALQAQADTQSSDYSSELQRFAPQQFDTVVDTFGLCSHEDPVAALKVSNHHQHMAQPNCMSSVCPSTDQNITVVASASQPCLQEITSIYACETVHAAIACGHQQLHTP